MAGGQWRGVASIPAEMRLLPGQEVDFPLSRFFTVVEQSAAGWLMPRERGVTTVRGGDLGDTRLQVRIFGLLPVRNVRVSVVPELSVIPGGQAIGVLISARGLVVGGTLQVMDVEGNLHSPAREAGLAPGDIISQLGGQDVFSVEQV